MVAECQDWKSVMGMCFQDCLDERMVKHGSFGRT